MQCNELLKGMDCLCGKHHRCDIGFVAIEKGAIAHLKKLCERDTKILLVADENTYGAAGTQTMEALVGKTVETVIFDGKNILIPDETAVAAVEASLDGVDKIVGVGSGVIRICVNMFPTRAGFPIISWQQPLPWMDTRLREQR